VARSGVVSRNETVFCFRKVSGGTANLRGSKTSGRASRQSKSRRGKGKPFLKLKARDPALRTPHSSLHDPVQGNSGPGHLSGRLRHSAWKRKSLSEGGGKKCPSRPARLKGRHETYGTAVRCPEGGFGGVKKMTQKRNRPTRQPPAVLKKKRRKKRGGKERHTRSGKGRVVIRNPSVSSGGQLDYGGPVRVQVKNRKKSKPGKMKWKSRPMQGTEEKIDRRRAKENLMSRKPSIEGKGHRGGQTPRGRYRTEEEKGGTPEGGGREKGNFYSVVPFKARGGGARQERRLMSDSFLTRLEYAPQQNRENREEEDSIRESIGTLRGREGIREREKDRWQPAEKVTKRSTSPGTGTTAETLSLCTL